MLGNLLFALASLYVGWLCYKFLHGVKFPKDGQAPSALKTLMVTPVAILLFICWFLGVMTLVGIAKTL